MRQHDNKQEPLWWTKNITYVTYMVREGSSLLIGVYALFSILYILLFYTPLETLAKWAHPAFDPLYKVIAMIGLAGAIIHSITWLAVMPTILPLKMPKAAQYFITLCLIGLWLAGSYYLSKTLYYSCFNY